MKKFKHALNLSDLPLTKMESVERPAITVPIAYATTPEPQGYIEVEAEEVNSEKDYLEALKAYNMRDVEFESALRKAAARTRPFPIDPKIHVVSNPVQRGRSLAHVFKPKASDV